MPTPVGDNPTGADVIAVMTPEVDQLVAALHQATTDEERASVWRRYNSEVADDG